jgi:hypothetical protein
MCRAGENSLEVSMQDIVGVRRAHDNGDKAELTVAAIVGDIQDSA